MLADLDQLRSSALASLASAADPAALEAWRLAWLGPHGKVSEQMKVFQALPKDQKAAAGQRVNAFKIAVEAAFKEKQAGLGATTGRAAGPMIDATEPGIRPALGRRHIITRVRDELCEVFARLGFEVALGPELEDDEHNFIRLNIPEHHPAREPTDNFYVEERGDRARPRMLRSQTSTVQIRVMEEAIAKGWGPPLKIVSPGRVYRPDAVDATHSFMFHQIEGLAIDHRVTMVELKTTLFQFARAYFGPDAEIRLRPSFFPFTEPSAEFDMKIRLRPDQPAKWIELGGCGMVDPAVFEAVGLDPEQWTGFAFGFGIERLAMGKYGIPDIRMLYENDLRFLEQL